VIDKTQEELRIEHSKALTKLHEEMQSQLKIIRQRLNNLCIERSQPKIKSASRNYVPLPQSTVNNPPTDGLGGKAGKSRFIIQVGEVGNLYKTSKRRVPAAISRAIIVDLHGYTKTEALETLDDKLPQWNDMAMSGSYPFVMPVEIICGGGNQILSEVVKQWIKWNDKVSNAPKNLWT